MHISNRPTAKTMALVSELPERMFIWKAKTRNLLPCELRACTPHGFERLQPQAMIVDGFSTYRAVNRYDLPTLLVLEHEDANHIIQANDLGCTRVCISSDPAIIAAHARKVLNSRQALRPVHTFEELTKLLEQIPVAQRNKCHVMRVEVSLLDLTNSEQTAFQAALQRRMGFKLSKACRIAKISNCTYLVALFAAFPDEVQKTAEGLYQTLTQAPLLVAGALSPIHLRAKITVKGEQAKTRPASDLIDQYTQLGPGDASILSLLRQRAAIQTTLAS